MDNESVSSRNYRIIHSKKRKNLIADYGNWHLCGECKHMLSCPRMIIQNGRDNSERKKISMKRYVPFATKFYIEPSSRAVKDLGFIYVFECEKFEFEEL